MNKVVASKMIFILAMCAVLCLSLSAVRNHIWNHDTITPPHPQKLKISPRESNTSLPQSTYNVQPIGFRYALGNSSYSTNVVSGVTHSGSEMIARCAESIDIAYIPPVKCDLKNRKSYVADVSLLERFPVEYLPTGDTTYRVRPVVGGYEVIKGYYRFDTVIVK